MMNKICILMATYNGSKYIKDQIKSILNQSYDTWDLFIRDDGSTDGTFEYLKEIEQNDSRIHVLPKESKNVGQLRNFGLLMNYVKKYEYHYFMFSDQDDVWYKDKISNTFSLMKKNESGPTLIYTNYDENSLNGHISKRYETDYMNSFGMKSLLIQNWIMGCTMMINSDLFKITSNIPSEAQNHDNWIELVALTYGNIFFLNFSTMFHRIHNNNVTNNFRKNIFFKIKRFSRDLTRSKLIHLENKRLMNEVLKINLPRKNNIILVLSNILKEKNKLLRIDLLRKNKFVGLNFHATIRIWLLL